MALAAVFYALQYFNVKTMDAKTLGKHTSVSVWTMIVFRGVVGFVVALLVSGVVNKTCFHAIGKEPKKLLVRGVLGAVSILCSFLGLTYLRLSVATSLLSTSPLWTGLLMACRCSPIQWTWKDTVGALLCMSGVVLVSMEEYTSSSNANSTRDTMLGVVLCLTSSFLNAVVSVTVQGLKDENPWVICLYPMACSMVLATPGAIVNREPLSDMGFLNMFSLCTTGMLSVLAQVCRTVSLQNTTHMGVVVLRYLDVPISVVLDIAFLRARPTLLTYGGIALIIVGGIGTTYSKHCSTSVYKNKEEFKKNDFLSDSRTLEIIIQPINYENTNDLSGGAPDASVC
jgi:drug/metabolite transporter (DMT)-like permease